MNEVNQMGNLYFLLSYSLKIWLGLNGLCDGEKGIHFIPND